MIVVNEIHDFEEIPPQVQYFVVFGSKKASATADAFFICISMNRLSERTSRRPSPVSAAKKDTTDENGEDHIHLLDAETSPFVSSEKQVHAHYSIFFRRYIQFSIWLTPGLGPVNIVAAFASPLSHQSSQAVATFA